MVGHSQIMKTVRKFVKDFVASVSSSKDNTIPTGNRVEDDLQERELTLIDIIDMGVYTRNRCFRMLFHSKFGKTI